MTYKLFTRPNRVLATLAKGETLLGMPGVAVVADDRTKRYTWFKIV
jgi:hypothetical protein